MTASNEAPWRAVCAAMMLGLAGNAAGAAAPESAAAVKDRLEVRLRLAESSPTNCALQVELKNLGTRELNLFPNDLPWATRHSLLVVLVPAGRGREPLPEPLSIEDPVAGSATLGAGETAQGTIQLHRRFPALLDTLAQREVICFWSYQLKPLQEQPLDRIGGHLVIPVRKS